MVLISCVDTHLTLPSLLFSTNVATWAPTTDTLPSDFDIPPLPTEAPGDDADKIAAFLALTSKSWIDPLLNSTTYQAIADTSANLFNIEKGMALEAFKRAAYAGSQVRPPVWSIPRVAGAGSMSDMSSHPLLSLLPSALQSGTPEDRPLPDANGWKSTAFTRNRDSSTNQDALLYFTGRDEDPPLLPFRPNQTAALDVLASDPPASYPGSGEVAPEFRGKTKKAVKQRKKAEEEEAARRALIPPLHSEHPLANPTLLKSALGRVHFHTSLQNIVTFTRSMRLFVLHTSKAPFTTVADINEWIKESVDKGIAMIALDRVWIEIFKETLKYAARCARDCSGQFLLDSAELLAAPLCSPYTDDGRVREPEVPAVCWFLYGLTLPVAGEGDGQWFKDMAARYFEGGWNKRVGVPWAYNGLYLPLPEQEQEGLVDDLAGGGPGPMHM